MSNTVAGGVNSKKRQWRRHANENTLEQNGSIDCDDTDDDIL